MAVPKLNQILITKKSDESHFAVGGDLFEIESPTTNDATIQSVAAAKGNEHTFELFPEQCLVIGSIPSGFLTLSQALPEKNPDEKLEREFLRIALEL